MCTGTLMLYANAQLFSMLMLKNMNAMNAHLVKGTLVFLTVVLEPSSNCEGYANPAVNTNWNKVMIKPDFCKQSGQLSPALFYHIPLLASSLQNISKLNCCSSGEIPSLENVFEGEDIGTTPSEYEGRHGHWLEASHHRY